MTIIKFKNMNTEHAVRMLDVEVGDLVFVHYEGKIHQAKVVGFRTSFEGEGWYAPLYATYIIYMGREIGNVFAFDGIWPFKFYKTVEDAVNGKLIKDIKVSEEEFNKKYLANTHVFMNTQCGICGWLFGENQAFWRRIDGIQQMEYFNGKVRLLEEGYRRNDPVKYKELPNPEWWFHSKEECLAHNKAEVVYLSDED